MGFHSNGLHRIETSLKSCQKVKRSFIFTLRLCAANDKDKSSGNVSNKELFSGIT